MKTRNKKGGIIPKKKKRRTRMNQRGGGIKELRMVQNYKEFALYMDTKIKNVLDLSDKLDGERKDINNQLKSLRNKLSPETIALIDNLPNKDIYDNYQNMVKLLRPLEINIIDIANIFKDDNPEDTVSVAMTNATGANAQSQLNVTNATLHVNKTKEAVEIAKGKVRESKEKFEKANIADAKAKIAVAAANDQTSRALAETAKQEKAKAKKILEEAEATLVKENKSATDAVVKENAAVRMRNTATAKLTAATAVNAATDAAIKEVSAEETRAAAVLLSHGAVSGATAADTAKEAKSTARKEAKKADAAKVTYANAKSAAHKAEAAAAPDATAKELAAKEQYLFFSRCPSFVGKDSKTFSDEMNLIRGEGKDTAQSYTDDDTLEKAKRSYDKYNGNKFKIKEFMEFLAEGDREVFIEVNKYNYEKQMKAVNNYKESPDVTSLYRNAATLGAHAKYTAHRVYRDSSNLRKIDIKGFLRTSRGWEASIIAIEKKQRAVPELREEFYLVMNDMNKSVSEYKIKEVQEEIKQINSEGFAPMKPQKFYEYLEQYVTELDKKFAFRPFFLENLRGKSDGQYRAAEYKNAKQITDTTTRNDVNSTMLDIITNESQDETATIKSIMDIYAKMLLPEPDNKSGGMKGGAISKKARDVIAYLNSNEVTNKINIAAGDNKDKKKDMLKRRALVVNTLKKQVSENHVDYEIDNFLDLFFPKATKNTDVDKKDDNAKVYETKEELITNMYSFPIDSDTFGKNGEDAKQESNPFGFDINVLRSNSGAWDQMMGVETFLLALNASGANTNYLGEYYKKPMFTNKVTTTKRIPNFAHSGLKL